jgi:NADH:ubiquinone oxidoreductase subunit C
MIYIQNSWIFSLNVFFKNEVFLTNSTLLENSAIDNKIKYNYLNNTHLTFNNNILIFYIYYFFTVKSKIVFFTSYNKDNLHKITSVDKFYKSASWLERETGEMFKVSYKLKTDTRRLLLDYSRQENPLLKDYPTEGFNDTFYNFFEYQTTCSNSTTVEL